MVAVSGDRWNCDFQESLILFDSGSDEHVCGHGFAPTAPTRETTAHTTLRDADAQGNTIYHEHSRDVKIKMDTGNTSTSARATLEVADAKGSIISAGKLVKKGFRAVSDQSRSHSEKDGKRI